MNQSSPCKILCLIVKKHKQTKTKIKVKSPYYGTVVTSETILLINYCIKEARKRNLKGYSNTTAFIQNKTKQNKNTHAKERMKMKHLSYMNRQTADKRKLTTQL